jgi:RimJ/RimL family protein N-acetyltransferase
VVDFSLRRATLEDSRFFWEVNNEPSVRAQSIATQPIPWEAHEAWFARKVADPDAMFFVAHVDGVPAAVARFQMDGGSATIGVALAPSLRGKGLGARVIAEATAELLHARPGASVVAWIRPQNTASLGAFGRAGYVRVGSDVIDGVALERFEHGR